MENSVNNNINGNVNPTVGNPTVVNTNLNNNVSTGQSSVNVPTSANLVYNNPATSNVVNSVNTSQGQVVTSTNATGTVNPSVVSTVNNGTGMATIPQINAVNPNLVNNTQNTYLDQSGKTTNVYVIVGSIVGGVLILAIILLVLLVTGVIGNRNRLTCTNTSEHDGHNLVITRLYRFEKGLYTRVDYTHTFTHHETLTEEEYNNLYDVIINNIGGVTSYGFGTKISREGNVVTITSYEPKYFDKTVDDIKVQNDLEGYTCK